MHVKNSIIEALCSASPGNGDAITYKEKPLQRGSVPAIEWAELRCMPDQMGVLPMKLVSPHTQVLSSSRMQVLGRCFCL